MADPFIAEIRIFAGNFAPRSWAFCDGALLPIAQNTAVFAIIGAIYGGDGRTTTALPDLRGRLPMHEGNGPGLTPRMIGQRGGTEQESLSLAQLGNHAHTGRAAQEDATTTDPNGNALGIADESVYVGGPADTAMNANTLADTGGGQPHSNIQPYLVLNYIFALQGVFPTRP